MSEIGEKIKKLRKQNGLTQEKLAETLGVSYQAVSKWETGVASPDLAMLVPLARIFQVSTDQLLEYEDRRAALEKTWQSAVREGYGKTLEISEAALREYPHDLTFLYRRACDEFFYADKELTDAEKKREYLERSVQHFKAIISEYPDFDSAVHMLVQVLPKLGQHEEAVGYAMNHQHKDHMLKFCLTGEELRRHHQAIICQALEKLLVAVTQSKFPGSLQTAEKILDTIISDGILDPAEYYLTKFSVLSAIRNMERS